jgi:hypothetical protein
MKPAAVVWPAVLGLWCCTANALKQRIWFSIHTCVVTVSHAVSSCIAFSSVLAISFGNMWPSASGWGSNGWISGALLSNIAEQNDNIGRWAPVLMCVCWQSNCTAKSWAGQPCSTVLKIW